MNINDIFTILQNALNEENEYVLTLDTFTELVDALKADQGFLICPETADDYAYAYWFYTDENDQFKVLTLHMRAVTKVVTDSLLIDVFTDILTHNNIHLEVGTSQLETFLRKIGKEILPLSEGTKFDLSGYDFTLPPTQTQVYDHSSGLYSKLSIYEPEYDDEEEETAPVSTVESVQVLIENLQNSKEFKQETSNKSVSSTEIFQMWNPNTDGYYQKVVLLRTGTKYSLIATIETGIEYCFEYTTSDNFEEIKTIVESIL